MKDKILNKLNEYYPNDEDYNKDVANELFVLLVVGSSLNIDTTISYKEWKDTQFIRIGVDEYRSKEDNKIYKSEILWQAHKAMK